MGEFFKPWRRKIGVFTLLIACAFMTGWIRSSVNFDGIEIVSNKTKCMLSSIRGQIRWFYAHSDQARVEKRDIRFPSFALTEKHNSEFELRGKHWSLVVGDFRAMGTSVLWGHYSDLVQTPGMPVLVDQFIAQIPYWSIVIPLALLSAYLLLSIPNRLHAEKPVDRVRG